MLKRNEPLPKPHTPDTMMPKEIVMKLANVLEQFEPIYGQPSDTDLTRIREVVALLLLQILYDKTGGTHNLICLIWLVAAYTTCYGAEFAEPTRIGAYNATIDDDTMSVVHARTEEAGKDKRTDCGTYEAERQETVQFIITVIKDTWVRELRDTETFYTNVTPKALISPAPRRVHRLPFP